MPSLVGVDKLHDTVSSLQIFENLSEAAKKVKIFATKAFYAIEAVFDPLITVFGTQPLADALGLKTLTHGTTFSNYLNIRCHGADPSKGGR